MHEVMNTHKQNKRNGSISYVGFSLKWFLFCKFTWSVFFVLKFMLIHGKSFTIFNGIYQIQIFDVFIFRTIENWWNCFGWGIRMVEMEFVWVLNCILFLTSFDHPHKMPILLDFDNTQEPIENAHPQTLRTLNKNRAKFAR